IVVSNQWNLRTGRKAIIVLSKTEESKLKIIEEGFKDDIIKEIPTTQEEDKSEADPNPKNDD
ncbi:MAG: hypothetical protein WBF67_06405, partial [Olleya sp.]